KSDVRITSKGRHVRCKSGCPLWAKSGLMYRTKKLFDHLVGAAKHRRGHHKAERFGGFEIDYQLVLGRSASRRSLQISNRLLHRLDLSRAPSLIEPWLKRTVEAQQCGPALAGDDLHPIAFLADWSLRSEIDIH